MDTTHITHALRRIYDVEQHRLVFWYDADAEFTATLDTLAPSGVKLLRLDQTGDWAAKIQLEIQDPDGRYLIYAPHPKPAPDDDWLFDVCAYSRTFTADSASLLFQELGLTHSDVRPHLQTRRVFLRQQDRLTRLKRWTTPDDVAATLDKKMLAVTLRADDYETFTLLLRLCAELCRPEHDDWQTPPRLWADVTRFGLDASFWHIMADAFGYQTATPTLYDLLLRLFVTDFANNLRAPLPAALQPLCLSAGNRAWNASVFLAHWRANVNHERTYRQLAEHFQEALRLEEVLTRVPASALADVATFETVERRLLSSLKDDLLRRDAAPDPSAVRDLISPRLDGFWTRGANNPRRQAYHALLAAADFLALRHKYADGFSYPDAAALFQAYTRELYRFDQFYRLFHEAAAQVKLASGWGLLDKLTAEIENYYGNNFLENLAATWGTFVTDPVKPLLAAWRIAGVPAQNRFFQREVKPLLDHAPNSKVYVVISDALRYEAAAELTALLKRAQRCQAELKTQLGVLPSYTALGMAALLPHQTLDYQGKEVVADGVSTAGLANRAKILAPHKGTALKFEELIKLNKEQGRELVRPHRVIYIYHNRIDATGDVAASESQTFQAVRLALEELAGLVKFIFNNLGGSQVLITADHGFLYRESPPAPTDRSALDDKPAGTLVAKKRYLIGYDLGTRANVWHGYISQTGGIAGDAEFWLPQGANRFHFVAGARFVHGGAMPQEIAVPVIFAKALRGQAAEKAQIRKVEVTRLGSVHRVVNHVPKFEFLQTEAVSERLHPRTLRLSLRDEAGRDLSQVVTVTFDSPAPALEERKKTVQLILKSGHYDKHRNYFLVLREAQTEVEYQRLPVIIDVAFADDF